MRVGVFTPLLSQLPLDAVLAELKSLNIDTVELGTGKSWRCTLQAFDARGCRSSRRVPEGYR